MGSFFSMVHIKNNLDRKRFTEVFYSAMKKRGFVACSESEAALSYLLAFSDGGWVTLTSEGYGDNPSLAHGDAERMAMDLKTSCFSTEVVDSDFAILKLFSGDYSDEVIVGDGSGYGIEDSPKGERRYWVPLLAEGSTWEQLSEVWKEDETFVEDILCEAAPLLGIEPKYMATDYKELFDNADDDANIVLLYFAKEKDGNNSKSMTLNDGFVKVFGERLEPLGFKRLKKIKSKQPYFVRVINNEILHIISYEPLIASRRPDYKHIDILGGVATLYRRNFDFEMRRPYSLLRNSLHFFSKFSYPDTFVMKRVVQYNSDIWEEDKCDSLWRAFRSICYRYPINIVNNEEMLYSFDLVFDVAKSGVLGVLDKVTDLNKCIDFFYNISDDFSRPLDLCHFDDFIVNDFFSDSEGLILIKTGYRDDGVERMKKEVAAKIPKNTPQSVIDKLKKFEEERRVQQVTFRNEILDDPDFYKRAIEEMERCKAENIEKLKFYGLF